MLMILQLALGMEAYMKLIFFLACMLSYQLAHAACDPGWTELGDSCYRVLDVTKPYLNTYIARKQCLDNGADMATVNDNATRDALYAQALTLTPVPEYVFIGLTDIENEGNFSWLDGTPYSYEYFANASEPNNFVNFGGEDCVAMRSKTKTWLSTDDIGKTAWNDVPCRFNDWQKVSSVACQKPNNGTNITVSREDDIIYQFIYGDCPDGWKPDNEGHCYSLINGTEYLANITEGSLNSSYAANEICGLFGGSLPVVRSESIMKIFSNIIRFMELATRPDKFYIGHTDVHTAGVLVDIFNEGTSYEHAWNLTNDLSNDLLRCMMAVSDEKFQSRGAADSYWMKEACCAGTEFEWVMCEKPENSMATLGTTDNPFWLACKNDTAECDSDPCLNGGTCADEIARFQCTCPDGYTGAQCETEINFCDSNPCQQTQYGAACNPTTNRYDCDCPAAWSGTHCETLEDQCYLTPCQNNATCQNDATSYTYTCTCPEGFTGSDCETNIDNCTNINCNNGTCVDLIHDFECDCDLGFTGPFCEQQFSCSPSTPNVFNASVTNNTGAFQGGYITYVCNPEQKFDDMDANKTIVCDEGEWSEDLNNKACTDHCESVPYVPNASVYNDNTRVGNVVNYTCDVGYRFPDNSTVRNITCMGNGNWSTSPEDMEPCEIVSCPELPLYEHQHLNTLNTTYATTVTFWCDVGYVLHDNTTARTIKCLADGDWTAELPPCEPVECPLIEQPANSRRNTSLNTYNTYAEYKCQDGMRMRDGATYRIIKCDATAEWSDNVTECDTNRCFPLPFVANATPSTTDALFGTRVTLTCIEGHKYPISERDTETMTCYDSGRWNPILSSCEPLYCPPLEHVLNAEVSENQTLFGTVVNYNCDTGHYVYIGPTPNHTVQSTECLATKRWSNNALEPCWPIQCLPPPTIEDANTGDVNFHGMAADAYFNYSQQATYTCLEYEGDQYRFFDGQTTNVLTCGADGEWDKSDVSCRKERCDPLTEIPSASPDSYNTSWYSVISYSCNTGYTWPPVRFGGKNKTTHPIVCQNTGEWNESSARLVKNYCDIKNCSRLEVMENATMSTMDYHYDTTVDYSCDVGFKFPDNETEKSRWCSDLPQWEPAEDEWTSCEIIHCPELPEIENATRNSNDTHYDTDVTFSCLPGYQFPDKDKEKTVTCTANETWTELPEGCEVIFCMPVPQWGPISFNSSENEFAATVSYYCQDGHAFEDELEPLDVGEKAKHVSEGRSAFCTKDKAWDPPLGNCIPTSSIAKGLAEDTTESEDAVSIGTICCSIMCVLMFAMVLLDLNKIWTDLKTGRENFRQLLKKHNKVSDSQAHIKDDTESTA